MTHDHHWIVSPSTLIIKLQEPICILMYPNKYPTACSCTINPYLPHYRPQMTTPLTGQHHPIDIISCKGIGTVSLCGCSRLGETAWTTKVSKYSCPPPPNKSSSVPQTNTVPHGKIIVLCHSLSFGSN